jgi:ketosteroid isomerase-like protein
VSVEVMTDNERVARDFFDAVYRADVEGALALMSEHVEWWLIGSLPASGRYVGKDAIVSELLAPFRPVWEGKPQSHTVSHVVAADDHVVIELTGGGTTAHGNRYRNFYCYVLRIRGGKVERVRGYTDTGYALGLLWGPQRTEPSFA